MRFAKMHGSGNDFVVVNASGVEADWPALAQAMCQRHFGVGADGLILALESPRAHLAMRMFNPDGSEAEMCGNGIRCLARFAVEEGLVSGQPETLDIDTLGGVRHLRLTYAEGVIGSVRVGMGAPELVPHRIPVAVDESPEAGQPPRLKLALPDRELEVVCLSLGNPHAVYFTDEPVASFPLEEVGFQVEHDSAFPQRVNFEVVNVVSRGRAKVRVWERGAGATLACGTGACAAVVAGRLRGHFDDEVAVQLPGGALTVTWGGAGEVYLEGPAARVFDGEWPPSPFRYAIGQRLRVTLPGPRFGMVGTVERCALQSTRIYPPPEPERVYWLVFEPGQPAEAYGEAHVEAVY